MSVTLKREIHNSSVIAFPTSKTAGALTIQSSVIKDFSGSGLSTPNVVLSAADASKITNNLVIKPYVSFDDGSTWIQAGSYTDLVVTAGTAEITSWVLTSYTLSDYAGKYFVLYDGLTPHFFWFDHSGSATKPSVAAFANATSHKVDISACAVDTQDNFGTAAELVLETATGATWATAYTAGSDTMTFTMANKKACRSADAGNMLATTAVGSSFGVTTQGVDPGATKSIPLCGRLRVDAVFDATGALTTGHGVKVDVISREYAIDYSKKIYANCVTFPTASVAGEYREWVSSTMYVETLPVLKKIAVNVICGDLSKITNDVSYAVETSDDGTFWRLAGAAVTSLDNGSGIYNVLTECETGSTYKLGKYARVRFYCDGTGLIASGHGLKVNTVLLY